MQAPDKSLVDENDTVICKLCHKGFAIQMALNNHVKIFHEDLFATADLNNWTKFIKKEVKEVLPTVKPDNRIISQTANSVLSQLSVKSLTDLAIGPVKYVIIESDSINQRLILAPEKNKAENEKKMQTVVESRKRAYTRKSREVRHIPGPFLCTEPVASSGETCNQIFASCCDYSTHFQEGHKRKKKSSRCQVCERLLLPNFVDDGSPFNCKECGLGFQVEIDMKNHCITAHKKVRPFKCGVCFNRFTQKAILMQHMRLHTGHKPFSCPHCGKCFTQKSTLSQHLRVHTKDKPYRCVVCDKSFTQYGILRQHMRTHTNIAPFQCQICLKKFKQSRPLSNHMVKFHGQPAVEAKVLRSVQVVGLEDQQYLLEIPVEETDAAVDSIHVKAEDVEVESCDDEFIVLAPDV